ncbi:MAG TPA: DUF4440 domain-containing protein [Allosphingosinicella sp.]|nr:DUF4440 domain-containing protein [Allosphingosinicella sp.]
MDDERIRQFETDLWVGGEDVYRRSIADDCVMVLPEPPFVLSGWQAIEAVSKTPRWSDVTLDDLRIARPQEGLIVIAYGVKASRGGESFAANCTSTYLRIGHEEWRVVQHQQSVLGGAAASAGSGDGEAGEMERAQQDAAEKREDESGYQ